MVRRPRPAFRVVNCPVTPAKRNRLLDRMRSLGVSESDIVENFILGSGPGGQKINKTASCVQLKHAPSGMVLKCQRSRSLALNRFLARRELCDRVAERVLGEKTARVREMEKIRRQKRRRSRRQRARMLEAKRHRGQIKQMRMPVGGDE